MQKIRAVRLFILSLLVLMLTATTVFANNNNAGDGGSTGTGSSGGSSSYTALLNHQGGIRLSIYWAPSLEDFEKGVGVQQLGKTIDVVNSGAVPLNTYMGVSSKTSVYHYRQDMTTGYRNSADASVVALPGVPRSIPTDKEVIARWVTGAGYLAKPEDQTWEMIPTLSQKMGETVTAEQFRQGYFPGNQKYGQYKVFYEPLIPTRMHGVGRLMTLRDFVRIERNAAFDILGWMPSAVISVANSTGLEKAEKVLNMDGRPNNWELPTSPYTKLRSVRSSNWNILKDEGWVRYAGVGVFTPESLEKAKLVKTYVRAARVDGGEMRYETVRTTVEPITYNPDGSVRLHDIDVIPEGVGYLNDLVVSYEDITGLGEMFWEGAVLPTVNTGEGSKTIGGNNVLGYNFARRHRLTYAGYEERASSAVSMHEWYAAYELYKAAIDRGEKPSLDTEADLIRNYYEIITGVPMPIYELEGEIAAGSAVYMANLKRVASAYERAVLDTVHANGKYIYTSDKVYNTEKRLGHQIHHSMGEVFVPGKQAGVEVANKRGGDIRVELKKAGGRDEPAMVYARYIFVPEPKEVIFIDTYKGGKYVTTIELTPRELRKVITGNEGEKTEKVWLTELWSMDEAYKDAEFIEYSRLAGEIQNKVPQPSIKEFPILGVESYNADDNFYVRWRMDLEDDTAPQVKKYRVEEWRLSRYVDNMGYGKKATMMLNLLSSRGHARPSLSPSGTYRYDTINPNGLLTASGFNPPNMKYKDYLHSKALTKGSYSVTLNKPFVSVDVTGNLNMIKSTPMTELRAAKWVTDAGTQSGLTLYDIKSEDKGKQYLGNAIINKKEVLKYGIKNQATYIHNRGVYYHYSTKYGSVCACYTVPYKPTVTYSTADYNVEITYERYKQANTDARLYDITKDTKQRLREENGRTTVSLQFGDMLNVYPEVPMLFANDGGNERVLFATGDIARKIKPVSYHTMKYDVFVEPTVVGTSIATANQARVKANSLGLAGKNVIHKGAGANPSYKITKDKGTNTRGELIVKTYALDIANNTVKTAWGNGGYSTKAVHEKYLSKWNMQGKTTSKLEVKVPNGNAVAYTGPVKDNNIQYLKIREEADKTYNLTVRGGVVTHVNGMTIAEVKTSSPVFYEALEGMRLVGANKDKTVLATFEHQTGKNLEEQKFVDMARGVRNGVNNLAVGKGWYSEDSTVLKVTEHTTVYGLPRAVMFGDKLPMTLRGLETPINKNLFYTNMSVGHTAMSFRVNSAPLGSGIGEIKSLYWITSRVASEHNDVTRDYGVPNVSITDTMGLH